MFITLSLNTDCIDIENEKTQDLLILAIHYNEQCLKRESTQFIKNIMTIENVCAFYCDLIEYKFVKLENICIEFTKNKMNQICKKEAFHKMDQNSKQSLNEKKQLKISFIMS
jgi:hypothetical protein